MEDEISTADSLSLSQSVRFLHCSECGHTLDASEDKFRLGDRKNTWKTRCQFCRRPCTSRPSPCPCRSCVRSDTSLPTQKRTYEQSSAPQLLKRLKPNASNAVIGLSSQDPEPNLRTDDLLVTCDETTTVVNQSIKYVKDEGLRATGSAPPPPIPTTHSETMNVCDFPKCDKEQRDWYLLDDKIELYDFNLPDGSK